MFSTREQLAQTHFVPRPCQLEAAQSFRDSLVTRVNTDCRDA
jgi:hypothetical protein